MPVMRPLDSSFLPQLQRYRAAEVDAVMLYVGFGDMGVEAHLRMLANMRHWIEARPQDYALMNKADVIERARASDRLAMGFDIEGVNAIGDQLSQLHRYHDLGVRWMQLACNNNRGGGCQDADTGLTPFGRDVIREMKRIDLRVCCNHTRYCTVRDVCEMATRPVFFSHSNSKAVYTHPRNIPDDLIRACAASGGVVGVNGIGRFLGKNDSTSATYARHQTREARRTCFSFSRRPSARLALVASSR